MASVAIGDLVNRIAQPARIGGGEAPFIRRCGLHMWRVEASGDDTVLDKMLDAARSDRLRRGQRLPDWLAWSDMEELRYATLFDSGRSLP